LTRSRKASRSPARPGLDEASSIRRVESRWPAMDLRSESRGTLRCTGLRPGLDDPKATKLSHHRPTRSIPVVRLPFEAFSSLAAVPPVTAPIRRPSRSPGACCPLAVATRTPCVRPFRSASLSTDAETAPASSCLSSGLPCRTPSWCRHHLVAAVQNPPDPPWCCHRVVSTSTLPSMLPRTSPRADPPAAATCTATTFEVRTRLANCSAPRATVPALRCRETRHLGAYTKPCEEMSRLEPPCAEALDDPQRKRRVGPR